jgi:hypothetical protein
VPCSLDVIYTCYDIFDLISLEGVPFGFAGLCLVANFGRTSLAWASMGLEAHRLDDVGPHTRSQRHAFEGLHDIMEDLIQPLLPKQLASERQSVTF